MAAALLAARLGTTAMHDPTEGGLAAGLHEMAAASGARLEVDRDRVLWWEPAIALCQAGGRPLGHIGVRDAARRLRPLCVYPCNRRVLGRGI